MRTTVLALLALSCSPESHRLLVASAPDGGSSRDAGSDSEAASALESCLAGEHNDTHGTPCTYSMSCSSASGSGFWTTCFQGEHLTLHGSHSRGEPHPECDTGEPLDLVGRRVIVEPDGTCIDVYRCDDRQYGLHIRWCQAGARDALRADAVATPWTDCESALTGARDGDPCSGALSCYGRHPLGTNSGVDLYLWCDAGITRIAPGQALAHEP